MKKIIPLLFCFVFFSGVLLGQRDSSVRKILSFSIGEGIPLGDFGSNYNSSTGETSIRQGIGYANPGPQLNITAQFRFKKTQTWFVLMGGMNSNSFDVNTFAVNETNEPISDQPQPKSWNVSISNEHAGKYMNYSFLGGISTHIPFGRVSLEFRLLAGLLYCQFPNVSYTATDYIIPAYSNNLVISDASESIQTLGSFEFAGDFGITLKYFFKKKFFVLLNGDVLNSPAPDINSLFNIDIWLFNYSGGIGYTL